MTWSTLPHDLLSQIADSLGLIEFLSFHGVCKDWRFASSKSSSTGEKSSDLWFLTYGQGSQCSLLSNQYKIYTIDLPELDGATCLASYMGWLLSFCNGSMFFFCPFSRAKIHVPNCPFSELSDHVAAFSCAPTSQDCIIVVIRRTSDIELELHMLFKGSNQWSKYNFLHDKQRQNTTRAAMFHEGKIHFLDGSHGLVIFDACITRQWTKYSNVYVNSVKDEFGNNTHKGNFGLKDVKKKLGLEANISITTCGTVCVHPISEHKILIQSQNIKAAGSESGNHLKGVRIQPRYISISPDQCW